MSQRAEMKAFLLNEFGEDSWVVLYQVTSKKMDFLIVSPVFEGMGLPEREAHLKQLLGDYAQDVQIGLMSLYTEEEAEALGVTLPEEPEESEGYPSTWFDLMKWSVEGRTYKKKETTPKVVAFYSFKGGVGRTTALVHAAWALANKGKKVVMIDMDFEAPSLHQAVGKVKNQAVKGLVDYLYERMNLLEGEKPQIAVTEVLEEVEVQKGRLFVIPAGRVDLDYISKVDDLRNLPIYDLNLWERFKEELVDQVQPDLILIDSRTGINLWGALSILTIADDSILFVNPNPQNREGIGTILTALNRVGIYPQVVLSPVIDNEIGFERAHQEWQKISEFVWAESQGKSAAQKPILIPYSSGVALADVYPHGTSLPNYQGIVELLDEEADRPRLVKALQKVDATEVLKSLRIESLHAQVDSSQIEDLFQKPPGFERFIDPTTVVIKGRKGVGKTQLHWTALHRMDVLKRYDSRSLEHVRTVYGHGVTEKQLSLPVDFQEVEQEISKQDGDWRSFWMAFAYFQLRQETQGSLLIGDRVSPIEGDLLAVRNVQELVQLTKNPRAMAEVEAELKQLNKRCEALGEQFWILYDGFEDVGYENQDGSFAHIVGLLSFALYLEEFKLKQLRLKIFLHPRTWNTVEASMGRKFLGRDMEIKWTWEDMMRLAYSQVMRSEPFHQLVEAYVGRVALQEGSHETVEKALEVLWGGQYEGGDIGEYLKNNTLDIKRMISDGNVAFFPSSLMDLLDFSIREQILQNEENELPQMDDQLLCRHSVSKAYRVMTGARFQTLALEYPQLELTRLKPFAIANSEKEKYVFDLSELLDWYLGNIQQNSLSFNLFIYQLKESGVIREIGNGHFVFLSILYE